MNDNSTQNKLDSFIKDSLKEYEVPTDMGNWAKMEQMLDSASSSSPFTKNKSIILSAAAGIVAIGTIAVFYFSSPSTENTSNEPVVQEETITHSPEPILNDVSASATQENKPENKETSLPLNIEKETEKEKNDPVRVISDEKLANKTKDPEIINDTKKTAEKTNEETDKTNFMEVFDKLTKDNVPTFGDQIDPTKGFVKPTQEEEDVRKEAEKKVKEEVPFGNPDAPDSTKTNSGPF